MSEEKLKQLVDQIALVEESNSVPAEKYIVIVQVFYQLISLISSSKPIFFRNFYASFNYVLTELDFSKEERIELDAFRRFIKDRKESVSASVLPAALHIILLILGKVYRSEKLIRLQQRQAAPFGVFTQLVPTRNYARLKDVQILVQSWGPLRTEGESKYFVLKGYDTEAITALLNIKVAAHGRTDLTYLHDLLTESMLVRFQNLVPLPQEGGSFRTEFDTLVAIEPDFLINATDVGGCFTPHGSDSDNFFLSKLVASMPGAAALQGSLVGYFLDEIVRQREAFNPRETFLQGQINYSLKAALFGTSTMQRIKTSIEEEHLANVFHLVQSQQNKDLWIEPTYFSSEGGLQGRVDLLAMTNGENSKAKDIVELKSGTPSNANYSVAWEGHKMQVVCYDIALDSTYGRDRTGSSAVYYSRKGKGNPTPHRNIVSDPMEKSQALKIRNGITAKIYELAESNFTTLDRIKTEGIRYLPGYARSTLEKFQRLYDANTLTTHYYRELLAFVLRELIDAKVGDLLKDGGDRQENGFASLWLDSIAKKRDQYKVLYDLEVERIDERNGHIRLNIREDQDHVFRSSELVILYPRGASGYLALKNHILKGSIKEINKEKCVVSLYNKQTDYSFIRDHTHWAIEQDIFEQNYWSKISCLLNVIGCPADRKALLFGQREPAHANQYQIDRESLTLHQHNLLEQALNAQDYYLLQGPPGTGKTSTFLVRYIEEALNRTSERIVVLAFTNKAVDKICENFRTPRTKRPIPYVRFGNQAIEDKNLFRNLIDGDNPDRWKETLLSKCVIVSTVTTFQNNWQLLSEFINFQTVVVDEASQLTEADISGVLTLFEKFVLIGDQKQLPAVVTQSAEKCILKHEQLNRYGICDLRISLFERLFQNAESKGWEHAYGQLTDHYRMHERIASLIEKHYSEGLTAGLPKQEASELFYALPATSPFYSLTRSRCLFIETPPSVELRKNSREAVLVSLIIDTLLKEPSILPEDIGVIAPFRAQVVQIKRQLPNTLLNALLVDTVERFQGDERKIILFSTTIADSRQLSTLQNVSSTDEDHTDRKLLVSLSRASEQLIMLGNSKALLASEMYRDTVEQIFEQKGYLERSWAENILSIYESTVPV